MGLILTDFSNYRNTKFDLYAEKSSGGLCYLLAIPKKFDENAEMVVESFNSGGRQANYYAFNISQALDVSNNHQFTQLLDVCEDVPILIPIIPDLKNHPEAQQLSLESVTEEHIDEKFFTCIQEAQAKVREITGKKLNDKIFLHGYSSSGVFAQRFAFIHPEIVDRCLIGGAAGTIPIPTEKLDYPIGIKNYETLFGKKFDLDSYKKIQFGYYVAQNEEREGGSYDINGEKVTSRSQILAPMHDMSYRNRSTPKEVGKSQRKLLGETMNDRFQNSIRFYKELGIDISAIILRDANHLGIFNSKITRSADYLKQQLINFYRKKEPLKKDSINCVSEIDDSFQKDRNERARDKQ